ncbi:MAG: RNA 2',3'-cyclic phosphodiesterase [Gammaproteobacteria bacterium]|nr:RNA 2',3'-cyclic phosphodiesterase [Gammaproteobacteria bacterium]
MKNQTIRAFFAIELPENVRNEIDAFIRNCSNKLQSTFGGAKKHQKTKLRWVSKEHLHLTILFLGNINSEQLPEITEKAKTITHQCKPFTIRFRQLELFPSDQKPHVLSLKPEPAELITTLALKLKTAISQVGGTTLEKRPFQPHLTLARIKSSTLFNIQDIVVPEFCFKVKGFTLLQSKASHYHPLAHFEWCSISN